MRRFYLRGCGPHRRVDFRPGTGSLWTGRPAAPLFSGRVSLGEGTRRDWLGRSTGQTFTRVDCVRNWERGVTQVGGIPSCTQA